MTRLRIHFVDTEAVNRVNAISNEKPLPIECSVLINQAIKVMEKDN